VLGRVDFSSIWSPFDLMIVPAHSSVLHAGRTMWVNVAAHPLMVRNPHVMKLVLDALIAEQEEISPSPTKETSRPSI
jgi:triacylglycerol lipase